MSQEAPFDTGQDDAGIPECCDGLLWIGQSYAWIDCRRKSSCAIPFQPVGDKHCFVHEAEHRGISRKLAAPPSWAVPGLTRIFLAHRGDQRSQDLGRLFGYFLLGRVETIAGEQPAVLPQEDVAARGLSDRGLGALEGFVRAAAGAAVPGASVTVHPAEPDAGPPAPLAVSEEGRFGGELEPGEHRLEVSAPGYHPVSVPGVEVFPGRTSKQDVVLRPVAPRPVEPEVKTRERKCPDGKVITTHVWEDGRWVRTRERCDEDDDGPECLEGRFKVEVCPEGLVITRVCVDGGWRPTGARCPQDQPLPDEALAEHRSCSLRLRPGAVYVVDPLAAEIHDRFHDELAAAGLRELHARAATAGERRDAEKAGRNLFNKVAATVGLERVARGVAPCVPPCLRGRATTRGELVLFDTPPVVERRPRASFRSLARVDGDDIVRQVAAGVGKVGVQLYRPRGRGGCMTWAGVTAALAGRCGVSAAAVHAVLDGLAAIAREELERNQDASFRLQNLGTFRWRKGRDRPGDLVFELAQAMRELELGEAGETET